MRLYSGPLSLFTGKVRIALDEKGLEYELRAWYERVLARPAVGRELARLLAATQS
jgi:glutathione S-transferase